jgi:hypothetical protein
LPFWKPAKKKESGSNAKAVVSGCMARRHDRHSRRNSRKAIIRFWTQLCAQGGWPPEAV